MSRSKVRVKVPSHASVLKDPRFYVGVLIIALSILGCTMTVMHARAGTHVYQVTRDISPGELINESNTRIVQARPESTSYVTAHSLPKGALAAHALGKNELVPRRSVTSEEDKNYRRLVIDVSFGIPQAIPPGTRLELWSVPQGKNGVANDSQNRPITLTKDAILLRMLDAKGIASNLSHPRIEVRIPQEDVPSVLAATGRNFALAAVTVGQTVEQ